MIAEFLGQFLAEHFLFITALIFSTPFLRFLGHYMWYEDMHKMYIEIGEDLAERCQEWLLLVCAEGNSAKVVLESRVIIRKMKRMQWINTQIIPSATFLLKQFPGLRDRYRAESKKRRKLSARIANLANQIDALCQ
jgi:hypothetical protein